jgi:hypothetical protein
MKLACIVMAHHKPRQLARLLSALRHPQVRVYLHLDRRAPIDLFTRAFSEAGAGDMVLLPRYPTPWGSPQLVDATLGGFSRGIENGCGYFVLISGQDFPLRPIGEIVDFLESVRSKSYLEYFSLPDPRWRFEGRDRTDFYTYTFFGRRETCIPRGEDTSFLSRRGRLLNEMLRARGLFKPARRTPGYVRPYAGSQWWNLSRDAVEYVLGFVDRHPDFRRYHEHTLLTEEIFFQSVLVGAGFEGRDELVNDNLRFMRWPAGQSHPSVLGIDDLPDMLASRKLFARKFDPATDEKVLSRLREHVTA